MRKIISILLTLSMVLALCACGGSSGTDTAEYSVGEMKFSLSGDFTLDKETNSNKVCKENELYASKVFTGRSFDLKVTASLAAYDNSSLDKYMEEESDITADSESLEDVKLGKINGKLGSFTDNSKTYYVMYALNDGFYYCFEAEPKAGNASVNDELKAIAETVSFDSSLIGEYSVTCGDLEYKISQRYAVLDFEKVDTSYDEHWFATAGDSYTELGSLYFTDWENGYDLYSAAYALAYELKDSQQTSEEETLGTYTYITGTDASGYNHIIAMFKYNDKTYCFNMFSKKEMTKDDIKPVLDSIKVTASNEASGENGLDENGSDSSDGGEAVAE
ncbi:MAG: hypothetical protein Q4C46_01470 [Bacillota bacterium]|nr:hypothetical protein [Bacillota bacterium]